MHGFLAQFQLERSKISIINDNGETIAKKYVFIPKENFINNLTTEMIELSHEHNLFHNDIAGIGLISNVSDVKYSSKDKLIQDLENSFSFKAIVESTVESTKEKLLSLMLY